MIISLQSQWNHINIISRKYDRQNNYFVQLHKYLYIITVKIHVFVANVNLKFFNIMCFKFSFSHKIFPARNIAVYHRIVCFSFLSPASQNHHKENHLRYTSFCAIVPTRYNSECFNLLTQLRILSQISKIRD